MSWPAAATIAFLFALFLDAQCVENNGAKGVFAELLQLLSLSEWGTFHSIFTHPSLTKAHKSAKLDAYVNTLGPPVRAAHAKAKQQQASIRAGALKGIARLTPPAQAVARKVQAVYDNHAITGPQECSQISNIMKRANLVVVGEMLLTGSMPVTCGV